MEQVTQYYYDGQSRVKTSKNFLDNKKQKSSNHKLRNQVHIHNK